jgi:hypothetical protein
MRLPAFTLPEVYIVICLEEHAIIARVLAAKWLTPPFVFHHFSVHFCTVPM